MKPFRLAIISSENSWYFRQLDTAAAKLGINVDRVDFSALSLQLNHHLSGLDTREAPNENSRTNIDIWNPGFHAVLVRTMPLGSLEQVIFRMDVLRSFGSAGIGVFNSPTCLETSIDKVLTLDAFRQNGIPFPETYACQTAEQALETFECLGRDVVVKPIFGGEGRGIIRICETEMAYRIFKSLEYSRSVIYCQQFIANVEKEFRVLFIGDKPFAMTRSSSNSWIKNAAQGGTATPYQPDEYELEMARKSAKAVDGMIVGVDILQDREGRYYVLEVNAVPGWKLLQSVTGIDFASEIIQAIVEWSTASRGDR